jgi:3-phenylpropionate/trans-cinnamate dioxygenase ferredoxin reductase subunit
VRNVVVVGTSLAGVRAAEALRAEGYDGALTLVGAEQHLPYDRPPLSKAFLRSATDTAPPRLQGVEEIDAVWRLGVAAAALDTTAREVVLADGDRLRYDGLVIATGAAPRVVPGLDVSLAGVHVLRTLDDALALRTDLGRTPRRVVVVGAGFIGLELASTCLSLGLAVSLVDPLPLPLERPLGRHVARVLAHRHLVHGTDLRLGTGVAALRGGGHVEAVVLADGSVLEADVVVVAVGVAPVTDWLQGSGIELGDGVLCRPTLETSVAGVVAAGDVARFTHPAFGMSVRVEHWTHAVESAATAARTLLTGLGAAPHSAVPSFWTDQVGLKVQGVGLTSVADDVELDHPGDELGDGLVARYLRAGRLVGAVSFAGPRPLLPARRELVSRLADSST